MFDYLVNFHGSCMYFTEEEIVELNWAGLIIRSEDDVWNAKDDVSVSDCNLHLFSKGMWCPD